MNKNDRIRSRLRSAEELFWHESGKGDLSKMVDALTQKYTLLNELLDRAISSNDKKFKKRTLKTYQKYHRSTGHHGRK